ncbi:MAG TPA: alpha/beta fold hydrolase [Acidimicrobiales bacterium]|nr:alpha/beta fold hydrolase [Acidimicrobiales bacterium]
MPYADTGGLAMYYELHGDGKPLVLILGLAADISEYPFLVEALSTGFRVLSFDNRGAGRTDKPDSPYSIEMMADDTVRLMDIVGIGRAHLVGVSMGGKIALDIALRHRDRVSQLSLVSTQASSRGRVHLSLPMRLAYPLRWLPRMRGRYPQPRQAFRRQRAASLRYDCTARLPEISVPTLILHGKKDRTAPFSQAELLQRLIPGARLVPFSGGHLFFLMAERRRCLDVLLHA